MPKVRIPRWNGAELRAYRRKHLWTQIELAEKMRSTGLEICNSTISTWEGGREPKSYAHLHALGRLFKIDVDAFFAWGSRSR